MMKVVIITGVTLFLILLIVPSVIAQFIDGDVDHKALSQIESIDLELSQSLAEKPAIQVKVYRSSQKTIEELPIEEYVRGVVASEMPADFEMEALKAQAMAARTYIIRRMVEKDESGTPAGSDVTDTVVHQVYQSDEELKQRWGMDYQANISKINQAVNETIGQILTYEGRPIDATFFSTSNGYTENSEDYWGTAIAYLRGVESHWDQESPQYKQQQTISIQAFEQKLGLKLTTPVSQQQPFSEISAHTDGNRVQTVKIEDKQFSGKDIRELLGLNSSDFTWKLEGNNIIIQTKGYGHGVGMSQWGANGMAQEGQGAEDIVHYYYQDIEIEDYRDRLRKKENS